MSRVSISRAAGVSSWSRRSNVRDALVRPLEVESGFIDQPHRTAERGDVGGLALVDDHDAPRQGDRRDDGEQG